MARTAFRFVFLFCLYISPVTAQAGYEEDAKHHAFYAEIVKTAETKHGLELIHFLNDKMGEDITRVHPISIWLRDNSISVKDAAKINSLYFLPYSDVTFLLASGYKGTDKNDGYAALGKSAMMTLYTYEALAMADAVRCADSSALGGLAVNTMRERLISPEIIATYKDFKKEDFALFAEVALTVEDKFAARPPNSDICGMGAARMADMIANPGTKTIEIDDPSYVGGKKSEVVPPEGYVYHPEYITDEEWQKARAKIRGEMMEVWKERYDKNAGVQEIKPEAKE